MSPLVQHFISETYTDDAMHRRVAALQACLELVHFDAPQQIRVLPPSERWQRTVRTEVDAADRGVLERIPESLLAHFTPTTVVEQIKSLKDEVATLPLMTLYVPVVFTDAQLSRIATWCRTEVTPGLLFVLKVDPQVVGGCAFVYKDVHFDWSLRRHLRAQRGMVTSLLNAYGES